MMDTIPLSQIATCWAGVTLSRHRPKDQTGTEVSVYRASHCIQAIDGQLPDPMLTQLIEKPSLVKRRLNIGDILIPCRFSSLGYGLIQTLPKHNTYASENVFVVRTTKPLIGQFLGIFFASQPGQQAIQNIAKPVQSYKASWIKMADFRELLIPALTPEQVTEAISIHQKIIQAKQQIKLHTQELDGLLTHS